MLERIAPFESQLPYILDNVDPSRVASCRITRSPEVHRIYFPFNDGFAALHRILPTPHKEPYYHPHPWPMAVKVFGPGGYELATGGYALDLHNKNPPIYSKIACQGIASYEMTHRGGWHWIRPLCGEVFAIMVTGPRWDNIPQKPVKYKELTIDEKHNILRFFDNYHHKGKLY